MPADINFPRISIVTPSYNQGEFLEETICSVLSQGYPNLEYIIIDGGSTDKSVEIIRKYEKYLAYWISEPDQGQYDALNKGFAKTTGEIMAWLNSDDKYTPWALHVIADIFTDLPGVEWVTTLYPLTWDERGRAVKCIKKTGYSRKGFFKGEKLPRAGWYSTGFIQQESTFWRRSLWERAGGCVDASLRFAGDFELWARFYAYAELYGVDTPLGGFRIHGKQKTSGHLDHYVEEAKSIFFRFGGRPFGKVESFFRFNLLRYIPKRMQWLFHLSPINKVCVYDCHQKKWRVTLS